MASSKDQTDYKEISTSSQMQYVARFAKRVLEHAQFQDTFFIAIC